MQFKRVRAAGPAVQVFPKRCLQVRQNDLYENSTQPHGHIFEQVSVWQDRDADGGDADLRAGRQRRLNDNGTRENVPLRGTAEKWSWVKYSLNNSFMN